MRILVTGATGLLGGRLVARLVREGHEVLALTRSPASYPTLRAAGATPLDGDLDDPAPPALPALDAVVHAAARFRFAGPREAFFRTNVDATARLLEASERAGARSFVYISAAGVVMDQAGHPMRRIDETAPTYPGHFSGYLASKARAEQLVLRADKPGFRTLAIRPPALWGPGDPFSRALPRALASGRFAFIERGEHAFSTCHVDNVIEAVQCALQRGRGGRAYFVADPDTLSFREFVASLAALQRLSVERVGSMSYRMAWNLGRLLDVLWSLARRPGDPPLSRSLVRMIGREFTLDDGAARRELGYAAGTSRAEGLRSYAQTGQAPDVAAAGAGGSA